MIHTSFMKIKLSELKQHPDNSKIYSVDKEQEFDKLRQSISINGQLEPISITKQKIIISGHRRFLAMKSLNYTECEVRIIKPENEIIALIEYNTQRNKTEIDILNESRYLERELKSSIGRGRHATKDRDGKSRVTAIELSKKLGVGVTKLKQLQYIEKNAPRYLTEIDNGGLSTSLAYKIVRANLNGSSTQKDKDFKTEFRKFLKRNKPSLEEIQDTLKNTYPYSMQLTDTKEDLRARLIKHLERLKKMNSKQLMLVQKQNELEHIEIDKKIINKANSLLPTQEELENYFYNRQGYILNVETTATEDDEKRLWRAMRVYTSSFEYNVPYGRSMSAFVTLRVKNKKKILGIIQLTGDAHTLTARDKHIGWSATQCSANRQHLVNMNVCVPTQPFGHNYLGGKYITMCSLDLIKQYEKRYKTKIVAVSTTSLHGSFSQYSNIKWFKNVGKTSGSLLLKPLRDEYAFWRDWFSTAYADEFEQTKSRTLQTQALLQTLYKKLGIKLSEYSTKHERGYFICPLYHNYKEFLTNKIKQKNLEPIQISWRDWYIEKAEKRFLKLKKEKNIHKEHLFYDEIDREHLDYWLSTSGI